MDRRRVEADGGSGELGRAGRTGRDGVQGRSQGRVAALGGRRAYEGRRVERDGRNTTSTHAESSICKLVLATMLISYPLWVRRWHDEPRSSESSGSNRIGIRYSLVTWARRCNSGDKQETERNRSYPAIRGYDPSLKYFPLDSRLNNNSPSDCNGQARGKKLTSSGRRRFSRRTEAGRAVRRGQ